VTQPHVILLDGPLAGQRIKAPLKADTYKHRETGTEYQLGFTVVFRCHFRVGWSTPGREPDALDCARWLTSEVVKQQLDDLWRGSGVGALTADARVARAEYEANAAIPPLERPVDHKSLAEVIRRAERFVQARRRARESAPGSYRDGKVAEIFVLDDGPEDGSGFTPLLEADVVGLIAAARLALGIEVADA